MLTGSLLEIEIHPIFIRGLLVKASQSLAGSWSNNDNGLGTVLLSCFKSLFTFESTTLHLLDHIQVCKSTNDKKKTYFLMTPFSDKDICDAIKNLEDWKASCMPWQTSNWLLQWALAVGQDVL